MSLERCNQLAKSCVTARPRRVSPTVRGLAHVKLTTQFILQQMRFDQSSLFRYLIPASDVHETGPDDADPHLLQNV